MLLVMPPAWIHAAELSPAGLWKTVDDNTGKPRGLVRLTQDSGAYQGKIEKIFPKPGEDQNPRCDKCEGTRHGQPIVGMTILWGLTKQGDEYQGGEILDPETGRLYRVKMKIEDEGKKLLVRGFIGFSLLGRTQVWLREE
ncbi:MAG: DUF2147 domain-containing protein [Candidatus Binatia bacterium]|jgi:uncharacterized protein (DUF2147 family)